MVTFKGENIQVKGSIPQTGSIAPQFELVSQSLQNISLNDFAGKMKVLNIFPSLDTGTCASSVKRFSEKIKNNDEIVVLDISMDLPFAASRFCKSEKIDQTITLSAFRSSFPDDYGVRIMDGILKGLCARVVLLLDKENKVIYSEVVDEITHEPNYNALLEHIS